MSGTCARVGVCPGAGVGSGTSRQLTLPVEGHHGDLEQTFATGSGTPAAVKR